MNGSRETKGRGSAFWILPGCLISIAGGILAVSSCYTVVWKSDHGAEGLLLLGLLAALAGGAWALERLLSVASRTTVVERQAAEGGRDAPPREGAWASQRKRRTDYALVPGCLTALLGVFVASRGIGFFAKPGVSLEEIFLIGGVLLIVGGLAWFAHGMERSKLRLRESTEARPPTSGTGAEE